MTKTVQPARVQTDADDASRLAELGYESHFERRMGLWENFALGFTYLSPVVGIYSVFALGFVAGGPPMIWSIVIAVLDNFLKPLLLGRGVDAPILVIFIGAIGGFLSMGIIGLFVGSVIFVLFHTLLRTWLSEEIQPEA